MKDWMLEAAQRIAEEDFIGEMPKFRLDPQRATIERHIVAIIAKHSPRCETCEHWKPLGERGHTTPGECAVSQEPPYRVFVPRDHELPSENIRMLTTYDFGCVQWEERK